ncbi:BCCT family transporter, partial [Pseudomonas sp. CrR25]|nr:BCCT family transporter [Pseudomonas sp. CrR25]
MGNDPSHGTTLNADSLDSIPAPSGAANLIDTDYVIGQDNIKGRFLFNLDIHGKVFSISALTIVLFVVLTLALQSEVEPLFSAIRGWLTSNLAWFFLGAANIFVLLCLGLIVSPLGRVRLGGQEATPDYSYVGWFSMLFAAGMGIGLMFYGVAEPMSHFSSALGGTSAENGVRTDWAPLGAAAGDAQAAASLSMAATIFHWGLHPWAIYAIVALALALFSFNKGLPLSIRSIFYPLLGERVWGWPGHVIDILAVFATLFGLATSLGLGAEQAAAGLDYLFGIGATDTSKVLLIIGITAIALMSVLAGLDKGVKRLSEINMVLALLLLLFIIVAGPTLAIVTGFFSNLGSYLVHLPALSNPLGREDANFSQGWTAFYWAWWISWSPFVGMFIARVSRGRTVREFLIAVLLVPSLVSVLWMTAFGGTAVGQLIGDGFTGVQDAAL